MGFVMGGGGWEAFWGRLGRGRLVWGEGLGV